MIEIEISKDIKAHEPKIMSVFTLRQLICVALALSYGIPLVFIIPGDLTIRVLIAMAAMTPVLMFGWIKLYGLPLEKYIYKLFINKYIRPSTRIYKSSGYIDIMDEEIMEYRKPVKPVIEKEFTRLL